jgi:hypothetical protein
MNRPQDLSQGMREQQVTDILSWCSKNASPGSHEICECFSTKFQQGSESQLMESCWLLLPSTAISDDDNEGAFLEITPWELTQYLAIFDYLYLTHLLSQSSFDDLVGTIASDEATILSNSNLRAEQVNNFMGKLIADTILGHNGNSQQLFHE